METLVTVFTSSALTCLHRGIFSTGFSARVHTAITPIARRVLQPSMTWLSTKIHEWHQINLLSEAPDQGSVTQQPPFENPAHNH